MARSLMEASQMQLAEGRMARNLMVASQMLLVEVRIARNPLVASQTVSYTHLTLPTNREV